MNKKVLVVGAGTAGLGAAIRLQHAGYNVEIYEQNDTPGGKMNRIEADGHQFDVGPTIVMMPDMYREVFELAGRDPDDYIPMKKLDPMYDVYFKDDTYRRYSISSDLTELTALFESRGTENSRGFLQYLSAIYERFIVAEEHFIKRPFRKRSDMYTPFMIRQALKLKTFDSADKMMSKFVPDKDLQRMLSFQTLYIGVSPQKGPSLYNIIPMIELLYGVYFIKGGMHTMAVQMARLFTELGGIIHYSSPVEQIVTENGRVTGLKVGGELVKSDYVVSNADFPYTITKLIQEPEVRGRYTPEAVDKMDYSCSCLLFYWGVEGDAPELACHSFVIGTDLDDNLASIFDGRLIKDPSVYLHIPSQVDPEMAPPGKSTFYCLIPVPELGVAQYEYDEETIEGKSGDFFIVKIETDNDDMFEPSETILVPEVLGYESNGVNFKGSLVLYVLSKNPLGGLNVIAVNGKNILGSANYVPSIPKGSRLIRMGRAASELDVQTAQFEALPTKMQNNCQIFKAQVEQSTFQKIANKEVGWNFSDQEEVAIIDMRLGMEKSFLFGSKARIYDANKREEIMLTGGIWEQAGKQFEYSKADFDADKIIDLCRDAFTANAGSNRKILIGGTGLIERLNKLDYNKVITANDTVTKWGIDFTELRSKFGSLYVLHSEVFDQCGHYDDGFVVDPEYITKYCHVPFRAEKLDLRRSGVRNTDAIVVTEASCVVLRYPQAHMRVVAKS